MILGEIAPERLPAAERADVLGLHAGARAEGERDASREHESGPEREECGRGVERLREIPEVCEAVAGGLHVRAACVPLAAEILDEVRIRHRLAVGEQPVRVPRMRGHLDELRDLRIRHALTLARDDINRSLRMLGAQIFAHGKFRGALIHTEENLILRAAAAHEFLAADDAADGDAECDDG